MAQAWLGLALMVMGAGGASEPDTWVLGPGSEPAVKGLAASLSEATGWELGSIQIAGEKVTITLRDGAAQPQTIALTKASLDAPESLSADRLARLRELVGAARLPWVVATTRGPPSPAPTVSFDPALGKKITAARARTRALRTGGEGHVVSPSLPPCPGCAKLREGEAKPLLRAHPEEPRVWVQAARDAWRRGHHHEALAALDVATRHERLDGDALRMWSRLTGAPSSGLDEASPPVFEEPVPWLLGLAPYLIALAGLAWLMWIGGTQGREALVAAGLAVVAGVAAWQSSGFDAGSLASPPPLHEALEAPLAGGPCRDAPALWTGEGREIYLRCDDARSRIVIRSRGQGGDVPIVGAAGHHEVQVDGHGNHPSVRWAAERVRQAVKTAEADGWRVTRRPPDRPGGVTPVPHTVDAFEVRYAAALVAAGVLLALMLCFFLARWSWLAMADDRLLQRVVAGLALIVVVGHVILPDRMVMVYTGYDLAARLFSFGEIPRYGAGVVALYGPFSEVLGVDHRSILLANRIFGLLTYIPLLALVVAVTGAKRLGVLVAMGLVVALPIVWRDHVSEAIISGSAWLLLTGVAALVVGWLAEERRPWAWLALAPLAAGSVCRPEAPAALACVLLGLLATGISRRQALALGAILALALLPQLGWFDAVIVREVSSEGIIAPSAAISDRLSDVLVRRNLFVYGPWLSSFVLVWVVAGCWKGGAHRRLSLAFAAAGVAWISASAVDLPVVSIPRVHLPALYLVLPVIALGAQRLSGRPFIGGGLIGLVALGAALSVGPVFGPSNADHEERLLRIAHAHSPPEGGCVTLVDFDDPPAVGHTQRHFPRYLFPNRGMVGLDGFVDLWPTCGGRAIAVLGTRCYMDYREPGVALAEDAGVLPVCTRFRDRFRLAPIEEVTIVNRTRWTFEMYPDTPSLDLGVYEVLGRRADP